MTGMETRRGAQGARIAAALVLAAAALSGCSAAGPEVPAWTAGGATGSGPAASPTGPSAGSTTPGAAPSLSASPGSTAAGWKVFTDPGKTISFDLPQEWIVQSATPGPGTLPGALKIEVKDADGGYLATLQTGLQPRPRRPARLMPQSRTSWSAAFPWTCRTVAERAPSTRAWCFG
ncbi:hypothetical protein ACOM2C_05905 [Pseudarthrobacter sp. So.54]